MKSLLFNLIGLIVCLLGIIFAQYIEASEKTYRGLDLDYLFQKVDNFDKNKVYQQTCYDFKFDNTTLNTHSYCVRHPHEKQD